MRFHPLSPDVKCPTCGADLTFVRVRQFGDLYQCASDGCWCQVVHYRNKTTNACGYAVVYVQGWFGAWTECVVPTAKGE